MELLLTVGAKLDTRAVTHNSSVNVCGTDVSAQLNIVIKNKKNDMVKRIIDSDCGLDLSVSTVQVTLHASLFVYLSSFVLTALFVSFNLITFYYYISLCLSHSCCDIFSKQIVVAILLYLLQSHMVIWRQWSCC